MKTAIVLSGGGAKGAYELGVWKALRKLDIKYDIVTGTSIGALNGIMMVQNSYLKCLKLWYFMNYNQVASMEINGKYNTKAGRNEIIKKYTKGLIKGGYEMDGLSSVIDYAVDYDKIKSSKIDYGLVITHFPSFKGKYVKKSELTNKNYKKYLLATASCFPAFKPTRIDKNLFIDGGYTDNIPINLALELGADNLIVVSLDAIGINKKPKKNLPVTYISPKVKLGSLLVFEKDYTRKYMKIGYNDTMKVYGRLDGDKYAFKKGSLKRNYDRTFERFVNNLEKYKTIYRKNEIMQFFKLKKEDKYNEIIESLMDDFNVDPTKIYRASTVNVMLKKAFLKSGYKKCITYRKIITKRNNKKELIGFFYNMLKTNKNNIKLYINIHSKTFLEALYLYSIIER